MHTFHSVGGASDGGFDARPEALHIPQVSAPGHAFCLPQIVRAVRCQVLLERGSR
jgi:hypothetical protein